MAKSRRRITKEFKAEVVNLIMNEGQAVIEVCRELDLHQSPVRRWVQQAEIDEVRGPAGDFKKAWKTACEKSGHAGILVHDLRRCAARNLSRADVPESVAMEITGHKTRSMYRRYRIVPEKDLREATEKLQAHLSEESAVARIVPLVESVE